MFRFIVGCKGFRKAIHRRGGVKSGVSSNVQGHNIGGRMELNKYENELDILTLYVCGGSDSVEHVPVLTARKHGSNILLELCGPLVAQYGPATIEFCRPKRS